MKRYLQVCTIFLALFLCIYNFGYMLRNYINMNKDTNIEQIARAAGKSLEVYKNGKWQKIFLKGVNLGAAKPGYFPGEFGITKEEYLRWFRQIKDMNSNVIRVYTLQMPAFYEALFEFNKHTIEPLYIIHGVWEDEEDMAQELDAFNPNIIDTFKLEISRVIDVVHGNYNLKKIPGKAYGNYTYDISPYVIGYILGIEWDPYFVKETNARHKGLKDFNGKWLYTQKSKPIEIFFANVGDYAISYETKKYKMQKPIAFTNWLTTDVIEHKNDVEESNRIANINTETIKSKKEFLSGLFASYHIYPYYPDFLNFDHKYINFKDEDGNNNSYKAYLKELMTYHNIPVVVSEFGIPTSRGITHKDLVKGFNQGMIDEIEQGKMNKKMLKDIYEEGYAGAIVFSWQDEWFKRTWNTMDMDDPHSRAYWADKMTNEQFFGLLSFDSGENKSTVYVDGNIEDWEEKDLVTKGDKIRLYMKSDEAYLYLRVNKENLNLDKEEILIPIDITRKSGVNSIEGYKGTFNKKADFIISIKGKKNSKILVNDYYNVFEFLFNGKVARDSKIDKFSVLKQRIFRESIIPTTGEILKNQDVEVGNLIHGNGNPEDKGYNSLADFNINGDDIEIRIPWLMLNVSNPAKKLVLDDFNKINFIRGIEIKNINVGAYVAENKVIKHEASMQRYSWEKWNLPKYHERLKKSYYIMQEAFKNIDRR
ncbi:family 2 glycosyl transferase [Hathewaya limosa]|uniref:Family 2 glycosyl transferase n=1 Tax=Hathewaya limosa TaxID=1536 RepID=A0ABU0JSJ0_HATLI|nr:family 2 glycosyl transferase [Hathewaya limosa]MDQ0479138.1 hypothetical protein [Hathewaya limosa]